MTKILDFAAICNKKRFSEWTHEYALIRKTPPGEIFDPSTGIIKNEYLVPGNFHNRHFLNWSCNLFGPFKPDYFKFIIISRHFNEYWTGGDEKNIAKPEFNTDYMIDEEFGYYFLFISAILKNLKIPFDKFLDGQEKRQFDAIPQIVHCPTLLNFWHFEIRWKDQEGITISPKKKSAWVRKIYSSAKNVLRQFCKKDPGTKTKTVIPDKFYINN